MSVIPKGKEFSPHTTLSEACDTTTAESCKVTDINAFADLEPGEEGIIVFCVNEFHSKNPDDFEIMTYSGYDAGNNQLTGLVHRDGVARNWPEGTYVASYGTWYSFEQMKQALFNHENQQIEQDEVHGLRVVEGSLDYYDGENWVTVETDLSSVAIPVHPVSDFSADPDDEQAILTWHNPDNRVVGTMTSNSHKRLQRRDCLTRQMTCSSEEHSTAYRWKMATVFSLQSKDSLLQLKGVI